MKDLGLVGLGVIAAITFAVTDSMKSKTNYALTAQACDSASKDTSKKLASNSKTRSPASVQEKIPAIYSVPKTKKKPDPKAKSRKTQKVQIDFVSELDAEDHIEHLEN